LLVASTCYAVCGGLFVGRDGKDQNRLLVLGLAWVLDQVWRDARNVWDYTDTIHPST